MNQSLLQHFDILFNPHSVALIGASDKLGSWGAGILSRLLASSFPRRVYPINKNASEIRGLKAYESIAEVPDPVDFAVIAIPFPQIPTVMEECVGKGVKAALIISGGLAETNEEGVRIEKEIVEIASRGGIRFIGPNCMGHFDTSSDLSMVAFVGQVRKGPVGVIAQSGGYGGRIVLGGLDKGLGFSKFVSSGNEADLHLEDYLEYLAQDEATKVIALYIEGLREGRRFFQLAREITRKKPIVAMKAGKTATAARAAKSHAAALAGSEAIYDTLFRQSGVIRVEEDVELLDVTSALLDLPLPKGRRVGILAEGGGSSVVTTDVCELTGLEIAPLAPTTLEKLNSILPPYWPHGNPVDTTDAIVLGQQVIFPCLSALMEDENVDAIMLLGGIVKAADFPPLEKEHPLLREKMDKFIQGMEEEELRNIDVVAERMHQCQKPLIISRGINAAVRSSRVFNRLREKGIPVYPIPDRGAKVLAHLVRYSEYLRGE